MNKKICYIICASDDIGDIKINKNQGDYIISVDAGYNYLEKASIKADMVLGDFDSLGKIPEHDNLVIHKAEKDDTDSVLAAEEGIKLGYKKFIIYGGVGGARFDHTVANIQLLNRLADKGGQGYLIGQNTIMTVIKDDSIIFDKNEQGIFSVFSMSDKSTGVNIRGAKYNLNNAVLTNANPTGVSNEFIGKECSVSVEKGLLLIIWNGNQINNS